MTFYVFPSTPPPTTTSIFNPATTASCWRVPSDIFVCNSCSGHHTSCNRSGKLGRRDRIRSASLSRKPLLINSKDPNAEVTIFPSAEKQVSKDWWTPAVLLFDFCLTQRGIGTQEIGGVMGEWGEGVAIPNTGLP